METKVSDDAVIYQLEKIDQGGDVTELFESQIAYLAAAWGYEIEEEDEAHFGEIRLPDGRYAGLRFEAYITKE